MFKEREERFKNYKCLPQYGEQNLIKKSNKKIMVLSPQHIECSRK